MPDRRFVSISIIVITVVGMSVAGLSLIIWQSNLLVVPPPPTPPGFDPITTVSHGLEITAETYYWQDFMPSIPDEGPPFFIVIWVNINNTGNTTITDFDAIRVSIYYYNTSKLFATLDLVPVFDIEEWPQIAPGENIELSFTNERDSIFSPTIDEGAELYSRILTTWSVGVSEILTTPVSGVFYTH